LRQPVGVLYKDSNFLPESYACWGFEPFTSK